MDVIEAKALLVRHQAAMREVGHTGIDGRLDLLFNVVCPSPALLAASIEAASSVEVGVRLPEQMVASAAAAAKKGKDRRVPFKGAARDESLRRGATPARGIVWG